MTFAELKKRAYHNRPIPDGLTDIERLQFIISRRVYSGYRCGEIDQSEAHPMMEFIGRYPSLKAKEQSAILRYAHALLSDDAGKGVPGALDDVRFVAEVYNAVNRRKPTVEGGGNDVNKAIRKR